MTMVMIGFDTIDQQGERMLVIDTNASNYISYYTTLTNCRSQYYQQIFSSDIPGSGFGVGTSQIISEVIKLY